MSPVVQTCKGSRLLEATKFCVWKKERCFQLEERVVAEPVAAFVVAPPAESIDCDAAAEADDVVADQGTCGLYANKTTNKPRSRR